ncbi:MAG TPA: hypothetical protein VHB25_03325 [Gemmatimonadaceae bacterium]|nr:hypothetical protein [Gemmatimonadaceae bacterium]
MLHRFVIGLLVGAPFVLLGGDGTLAAHKDMTEIVVSSATGRPVEVSISGSLVANVPRKTGELLVTPLLQTYSRDHELVAATPVAGTANIERDSLVIRAAGTALVHVVAHRWRGEVREATGRVVRIVRRGNHIDVVGSER